MLNQNCRVGNITPIEGLNEAFSILESRYQHFTEMAAKSLSKDPIRGEFFQAKANSLKKVLEDLAV